jgi:hypothetical protein
VIEHLNWIHIAINPAPSRHMDEHRVLFLESGWDERP